MKEKRSLWTKEEEEFLKNNLHLSEKELAKKLNKTVNSVNGKKKRLGLSKPKNLYVPESGEIFKPIQEVTTGYKISNYGHIINIDGELMKTFEQFPSNRTSKAEHGYEIIKLYNGKDENGKELTKTFRVHVLVAKYFIVNPKPNIYNQVNHIDGNKMNNKYTNLEWCNNQLNSQHAVETGLFDPIQNRKLSDEQVEEICIYLTECDQSETLRNISKKYNVNEETIRGIYRGITWTNISKDYINNFVVLKHSKNKDK